MPAPLYPTTVVDTPVPEGSRHEIQPGSLIAVPFDLGNDQMIDVNVTHIFPVQDHSLRVWISVEPLGASVTHTPNTAAVWHANRTPHETVLIYDALMGEPERPTKIGLVPGRYFVNVLNLINIVNGFSIRLTEIQ